MDHGLEALVGFVGAQGDAFEFLELAEEVLDEMTPFVHHGIEALSRQQDESDEVAERIGEGQDLGRHAALGLADGLALSPPFAPCPWRWTLTMVASTMAYSMSGSSEAASKSRLKT